MNSVIRVMVTGAGALLGQGILRCLQPNREEYYIVTADPDYRSAGHWLGDKAVIIPMAKSTDYLPKLEELLLHEKIDILLIGTDVELPILSQNQHHLEKKYNVKIVVSGERVIEVANDKWLTAKFLKENDFPFPYSVMASNKEEVLQTFGDDSYPLFSKPIDGARSKGIRTILNRVELNEVLEQPSNLVIQEFLPEQDGEFTAGCLVLNGVCKAIVVLKRDLRDGNTYRAYSYTDKTFDHFLSSVAVKLGVEGPVNFQFRLRKKEPVIFEINARFSGTTPLRMMFGFNEVKATIDFYKRKLDTLSYQIQEGVILRTWSDILISKNDFDDFKASGGMIDPQSHEFSFKIRNV